MRPMGRYGRFLAAIPAAALAVTGLGMTGGTASASTAAPAGATAPAAERTSAAVSTPAAHRLPDFGNPDGHASVPRAGGAVNTSHPTHVVGTGTPASCTYAAVVKAVASGGI